MKKVLMYTLSTCPHCRKAKKFFEERDIPFEFIDYDLAEKEDRKRMSEEMRSKAGGTNTPFVMIGDDFVVGYNPKRYSELLGID